MGLTNVIKPLLSTSLSSSAVDLTMQQFTSRQFVSEKTLGMPGFEPGAAGNFGHLHRESFLFSGMRTRKLGMQEQFCATFS